MFGTRHIKPILIMIKYSLFKNHLTQAEKDCVAFIQERRTITLPMIMGTMTGRGKSITDTQVLSVLNEFSHVVSEHLKQGDSISTDMFSIMPSIKGSFEDSEDSFDAARHTVSFNMKLGKTWKVDTSLIEMQKVAAPTKTPMIVSAEDRLSETMDESLSPKGTLDIRGIDLKINEGADDEGIFFLVDQTATKATKYYANTDKKVEVRIPELTSANTCSIEIRKRYGQSKQLYTFTYDVAFTIL